MPRAKFKRYENQIASLETEPTVVQTVAVADNASESLLEKLQRLHAGIEVDYKASRGERSIGGRRQTRQWLEDINRK